MTRDWSDSTFVFVSTRPLQEPGGAEDRLVEVMAELVRQRATVRLLAPKDSEIAARARKLGVGVDPYILDKWNVIRARSRLRKYLRRYHPVVAHSLGIEADLILRWAARRVPGVTVVSTIPLADEQGTRRRPTIDRLMRRYDSTGVENSGAVFIDSQLQVPSLRAARLPENLIVLDPPAQDASELRASVRRHLETYRRLMADRGSGAHDPNAGRGGKPPRHGG